MTGTLLRYGKLCGIYIIKDIIMSGEEEERISIMNDKQIECFMAVAETLNFTHAAEKIYLSQPTISRLIYTLEEELGFKLFYRSNKEVRLTSPGVVFYQSMKEIQNKYEETLRKAKYIDAGMTGELRIGLTSNLDLEDLWEKEIPEFQKTHPNIVLTYECESQQNLKKNILSGLYDLAFIHTDNFAENEEILSDIVFETKIELVCGKQNPIAITGEVTREELEREVIWTVFPEELQNRLIEDYYREMGVKKWKIKRTPKFSTALINVRMGNGILFMDPITKQLNSQHYCKFSLPEQYGRITFSVIWKKSNMNPALPQLLNFLTSKEK